MPLFRKKPIVVEAIRLTQENVEAIRAGMSDVWIYTAGPHYPDAPQGTLLFATIMTLEGEMTADPGDWIITGVKGERYPCKPDVFAATYDQVED